MLLPLMLLVERPLLVPPAIGPPFAPAPFISWLFMLDPAEPRVLLELPLVLGLEKDGLPGLLPIEPAPALEPAPDCAKAVPAKPSASTDVVNKRRFIAIQPPCRAPR
jgi:hypothetical protein